MISPINDNSSDEAELAMPIVTPLKVITISGVNDIDAVCGTSSNTGSLTNAGAVVSGIVANAVVSDDNANLALRCQ